MLDGVRRQIRAHLVRRALALVVEDVDVYETDVHRVIVGKYRAWEIAIGEAAIAYELRGSDPDAWRALEASAIDARAEFIDAVREYLLIDLTGMDALPIRPAHYAVRTVALVSTSTGDSGTAEVLSKEASETIPELNYPTPWWRGTKLSAIRARIHSLSAEARRIREAGIDPLTGERL